MLFHLRGTDIRPEKRKWRRKVQSLKIIHPNRTKKRVELMLTSAKLKERREYDVEQRKK